MRYTLIPALLAFACDVHDPGPPPVAGTGTVITATVGDQGSSSGSSSSTTGVAECDAFIGCMGACSGDDCPRACASATNSEEAVCTQTWCNGLVDACAHGDTAACHDVLACAEPNTSSGSGSGSGSEGSSTSGLVGNP